MIYFVYIFHERKSKNSSIFYEYRKLKDADLPKKYSIVLMYTWIFKNEIVFRISN